MTEPQRRGRNILVLDVDREGDRRLAETADVSGYGTVVVETFDDLADRLRDGAAAVALVAFDALWPAPEARLKKLRAAAAHARLIVAYRDGGTRLALGRRLWSVNLIDYWIPRSTPPQEMVPLLLQAHAEALIERAAPEIEPGDGRPPRETALESLENLGLALNNARGLDELLRVFHRKLHRMLGYRLLHVLLCDPGPARLFSLPATKITHEEGSGLADRPSFTVSDALPLRDDVDPAPAGEAVIQPMMLHGRTVGCVGLVPRGAEPPSSEQRAALAVAASQLAAAVGLVELLQASRATAETDAITGLPNRKALWATLLQEWHRVTRYPSDLTVVLLDIDDFRDINERQGHAIGDRVLAETAAVLGQYLRETDRLLYFGEDRFLLLMVETDVAEAAVAVERMRLALKKRPILESGKEGPIQITCSAGIASYPACPVEFPEDLIDLAVRAIDKAKNIGRDQVIAASKLAFEEVFDAPPATGEEKRRYPRIPSDLVVKYLELPDFEGHLTTSRSFNVNARGIAIEDPESRLRKHAYALVYVEDAQMPVLSRVVWTQDGAEGRRSAGLEFLQAGDFDAQVKSTHRQKAQPKGLVITDNPETWTQVQRVLIAARYQLQILKRGMEIPSAEELEDYALIVVGEQALRDWLGSGLDVLRSRLGEPARVVVINESESRIEALETIARYRIDHFVSSSDLSDAALFATLNKLLIGEYFGMQKYLLWGVTPKSWIVRTIDDKDEMLEKVRLVAQEVYCHPRITDLLVSAVDEMVINAMYHDVERGRSGSPNQVTVECGTDGRLLAVSVIDEEGTFLVDDLHRSLTQGLARRIDGVPEEAPTAGLGFRIMLDCLSQLAINAEPGKRTEVIGIVDLRKPFREYRRSVPTLGLFDKSS